MIGRLAVCFAERVLGDMQTQPVTRNYELRDGLSKT